MTSLNTSSIAICDCLLELYSWFFCKSTGIITKINYRYKQQNILSCFLLLVFDLFENGLSWSSFVFILTPSICFSITGIFTIFWLLWNSLDPLWSAALQALFLLLFFMFCKFFFFFCLLSPQLFWFNSFLGQEQTLALSEQVNVITGVCAENAYLCAGGIAMAGSLLQRLLRTKNPFWGH